MGIEKWFSLEGQKAFVTGGARGIGYQLCMALAEAGVDVAVVDLLEEPALQTVEEIRTLGQDAFFIRCDVTEPEDVANMSRQIQERFGRLDIAVNNAGICEWDNAEEMSYEKWNRVIDVNLTGVFLTAQAAGRFMIPRRCGSIINTASMSAQIVNQPQNQCSYNVSKAGVVALTKSLAAEWAPYNVRVNCISPGYTSTEMTMQVSELHDGWIKNTPMGRMAEPHEIQAAVLFLASPGASYVTGHDLVIDGGFTLW